MASESVSKSVVWQLVGKFALQGIAFFTAPIFTRLLSPEDYGYTALYASWVSIVSLFIGLMTYGSIVNARIKYEKSQINGYLSSIMSLSVISFLVFFVFSFVFRDCLSDILGIRKDLVILVVIQSFCSYVISFCISKFDNFKQVEKSTIVSISQSLLVVILSLIVVINANSNKAIAKIYSQAIPCILYGIVILIIIYKNGKIFWNAEYNKFCLSFTLPLLFHGLGGLIFSQSDRIMISKLQNDEMLGIYSVAYALCNVIVIIQGALNVSWVPFYMDYKKQNNKEEILQHSKRYIKFFTILCIGFVLLAFDVFKLMAPEKYWSGMTILPILVLSFYFGYLYLFPVNFEFFHCKTKLIPIATMIAAVINIGVNFILIPKYGLVGAALGTLVAHFLEFLFHFVVAKAIIKQEFEYNIFYFLKGVFVLLVFVIIAISLKNVMWARWCIAAVFGIYLVVDIVKNRRIF